jgi:hypothetical protein
VFPVEDDMGYVLCATCCVSSYSAGRATSLYNARSADGNDFILQDAAELFGRWEIGSMDLVNLVSQKEHERSEESL